MGTLKNSKLTIKNSNEFPCSYIDGRSERRVLVNIPNSKIGNEVISELTKKVLEEITIICIYPHAGVVTHVFHQE